MKANWLVALICFLMAAVPSFAKKRHAKPGRRKAHAVKHTSFRSSGRAAAGRISYRMPTAVVPQENRGWMYATEISGLGRPRPKVDYSQAGSAKAQPFAVPEGAVPGDNEDAVDTDALSELNGLYGLAHDPISVRNLRVAAEPYLGIPYKGRRRGSVGYDCSGFVRALLGDFGVALDGRSSQDFFQLGESIRPQDLQPGDLVFFSDNSRRIGHVGVYVDSGVFVHSALRGGIMYSRLDDAWYHRRYQGARRIGTIVTGLLTTPRTHGPETALSDDSESDEASN